MHTCENCGAQLPANARFCPNCAAPVAPGTDKREAAAPTRSRARRWAASVAFALLVLLNVVVITFAVLVFGFGLFIDD